MTNDEWIKLRNGADMTQSKSGKQAQGSSHTPGPWVARENPDPSDYQWRFSHWIDGPDGVPVAEIRDLDDDGANARLIAAAPMGLALAYRVVKTVSCGYCRKGDFTHESSCCMARAFLAAAEGRDAD